MWFALLCFLHQLHAIFINWALLLWAFGASDWINSQFTVTSYHQSTILHHHHLLVLLLLLFILVFMQYSNFFSFLIFWSCQAACRTLVPPLGVKSTTLQWENRVLTTGTPGKSHQAYSSLQEECIFTSCILRASLMAQGVKKPPAMQET